MHRRNVRLAFILSLAGLALLPAFAQSQGKYKLYERRQAGDAALSTTTFAMTLSIDTVVNGSKGPTMAFSNKSTEAYTETRLVVDPKGNTTAARRAYTTKRETETQPGDAPKTTVSSLEGKTVTLKRVGSATTVTVAQGTISAADRKELAGALDNDNLDMFPDHEVGPGDEWTVESKELARSLSAQSAKVTAKFEDVTTFGGHQCVKAAVKIDAAMRPGAVPLDMTMALKGYLYYALDLHQTIAVELTGPVTAKGSTKEQGQTIDMDGTGTMTVKMGVKVLKAAGKPVG